jgi:glycosyltransferase involved in cell wall biosynthesis
VLARLLRHLRRLRGLNQELDVIRAELRRLAEENDLIKSRQEVARAWIDEFQAHKAACPIPAEPLVSVCIATYNRAQLLTKRCIPSVLAQTYGRFELIVVGDGCSDDTARQLAQIHDPRLVFANLPVRGSYPADRELSWMVAGTSAINQALEMSRGDFVTHLDDDDEYLPGRLEALVQLAISQQCDFIWHPFWAQAPDGRWYLNQAQDLSLGQVTTSSVFYRSWLKRIGWDPDAYLLREPGDWNRFRKIKFLGAVCRRHPQPFLKHYRERNRGEGQEEAA